MKRLLTEREVCEKLLISKSTCYRLRKAGKLVAVSGLGMIHYDPDVVEEFIKRSQTIPTPIVTIPVKVRRQEEKSYQERQQRAADYLDSLRRK